MSLLPRRSSDGGGDPQPSRADPGTLFSFEARRGGRPVAVLTAVQSARGVTVETEVHPVGAPPGEGIVRRPFSFQTAAQARRFGDEALTALEYLGCSVA